MSRRKRPIFARRNGKITPGERGRPLRSVEVKLETGFVPERWPKSVRRLRSGQYRVDGREVGGEAPKDFVWVQGRGVGERMPDAGSWAAYVAKVGHKLYPSESITEQLITRIGQIWGLDMADSRLMLCAQQVRFMSRYFLRPGEILNHGADIVGGYLADTAFVEGVANQKAERVLFTFQVFCTAISARFFDYREDILRGFVRMIAFDALVGNQDRHIYNWGVITHATGAITPKFSPIFDSARGLFWNDLEPQLVKYRKDDSLKRYVRRSTPEISWDGWTGREMTHFDLAECIAAHDTDYCSVLESSGHAAMTAMPACEGMIDAEFKGLLSDERRELIKRCLRLRIETFVKIF